MRVQFSVNREEWDKLQKLSQSDSYPDVSSYCRDTSLQERTYAILWEKVRTAIAKMPSGTTFALRDLIQTPPANLGVILYKNQTSLGIKVNPKKDSFNTNTYTKI